MATLKQFFETGELGPIHHGMTEQQVIAILGAPQDESVERNPRILKYGGLQIAFTKRPNSSQRVLTNISLYFGAQTETFPESTRPTDFEGSCETTVAEFCAFLDRNALTVHSRIEGDETNHLVLPSGVRVTFDGQTLHSIHFAARRNDSPKKQISVAIDEETWKQLQTLAQRSKKSVGSLCGDWIAERASENEVATKGIE